MTATASTLHSLRSRRTGTFLAGAVVAFALSVSAAPAYAAGCDFVASPAGSDSAAGTAAAPFQTVQHLVNTLAAGQTGCLASGSYTGGVRFGHGGSAGAPLTLTSVAGSRATIVGRIYVPNGSDFVTVANLNLDGLNHDGSNGASLPSPTLDATSSTFTGDDVTNEHTSICFDVGSDTTYGRAINTVIQGNRIHDCGGNWSNHDHGIYVEASTGAQITNNVIFNNADRGVQLYPDAQGSVIENNIIADNGEGVIFSGDFGIASNGNIVKNNIITGATAHLRSDVESWYPTGNPIGQGNVVESNCAGSIDQTSGGFTVVSNSSADPGFANSSTGDFRVSAQSPCAALLAASTAPVQSFSVQSTGTTWAGPATTTPPVVTTTTPPPTTTTTTSTTPATTTTPTTTAATTSTATTTTTQTVVKHHKAIAHQAKVKHSASSHHHHKSGRAHGSRSRHHRAVARHARHH